MRIRSYISLWVIFLTLAAMILPGCSTMMDLEYDEYVGTFSVPNLGKRTLSLNALAMTVWFNEGKVEGEGKAVLDGLPQAGSPVFTDAYTLKFTGTFDGKTGKLYGLVGVKGGITCKSNCAGTNNAAYDHSSYWQAEVVSGKIVNGKISAYPDFKTSYFLFEAGLAKTTR